MTGIPVTGIMTRLTTCQALTAGPLTQDMVPVKIKTLKPDVALISKEIIQVVPTDNILVAFPNLLISMVRIKWFKLRQTIHKPYKGTVVVRINHLAPARQVAE